MKVIDTVSRMMTLSKMLKKEGKSIGLVPTMGALHEGHLTLARTAKQHTDVVVMSIFVNPLQFGPQEDFERYPRDFKNDEDLAASAGVDVVFYPSVKEMYAEDFATYVTVDALADKLCGKSRPGHFCGVATVVTKLFGIVRPDLAYFGQKDAQQAAIITRMTEDLNLGVEVKIQPTVREKDGLAMSSRNAYLSSDERAAATVLYQALQLAESMIAGGEQLSSRIVKAMAEMIGGRSSAKVDYIAIVDPRTLKDASRIKGEVLVALAVIVGTTRLIDNVIARPQENVVEDPRKAM